MLLYINHLLIAAMNIQDEVVLAIDTAYAGGVVAAFDKDQVYAEVLLQEKMAHGKLICSAIEQVEARLSALNKQLTLVMVGKGPGSFVGLRIALATAMGFAFGRALPLMGFCSHRALLGSKAIFKPCSIVMKASGDWCYMTTYVQALNEELCEKAPPAEMLAHEIQAQFSPQTLLLSDVSWDKEALSRANVALIPCNGPNALGVKAAAFARLRESPVEDESNVIKPNYVRAPSVTCKKL